MYVVAQTSSESSSDLPTSLTASTVKQYSVSGSKSSTESIQQNTKAIQDQSKAMNTQSGKYYPALINEVDKYRKRNDDLNKTIRDLSTKNEEIKKRISGLTTVYQQSSKAAVDAKSKYEEFLKTNPNLFASRLGPE